jgi:hypothetical protein
MLDTSELRFAFTFRRQASITFCLLALLVTVIVIFFGVSCRAGDCITIGDAAPVVNPALDGFIGEENTMLPEFGTPKGAGCDAAG